MIAPAGGDVNRFRRIFLKQLKRKIFRPRGIGERRWIEQKENINNLSITEAGQTDTPGMLSQAGGMDRADSLFVCYTVLRLQTTDNLVVEQ